MIHVGVQKVLVGSLYCIINVISIYILWYKSLDAFPSPPSLSSTSSYENACSQIMQIQMRCNLQILYRNAYARMDIAIKCHT